MDLLKVEVFNRLHITVAIRASSNATQLFCPRFPASLKYQAWNLRLTAEQQEVIPFLVQHYCPSDMKVCSMSKVYIYTWIRSHVILYSFCMI